jgi:hypothetical protein
VAGWEGDVSRRGFADWAERKSRSRARSRRKREKYVRKTVVAKYLRWLEMANNADEHAMMRETALKYMQRTELRDVERIAIDERLGISGVPTNLEGRR